MERDYPKIRFAGSYSPPFKQDYTGDELDAMIAVINQARPDILWVGMTAPKQEKWIHQNLRRLDARFAAAIGAVFDFYTGRVKRSQGSREKGVSRAEKNQVTQTIFRVRMLMARLS